MIKEKLIESVLQSDELPTLPTVASQLISLTSKEDATLAEIGELVSKDISLSAKILKVSNSSFYSFPQQIGSIKQAVSILGMNAVRSLVLSFSFLTMRSGEKKTTFNFKQFWQRSLASAVASKLILEQVKGANTEEIFISGLLQNLGQLILAKTFPQEFEKVLAVKPDSAEDIITKEEEVFGNNHAIVGTEVAKHWGFPEKLVVPIEYHHKPLEYKCQDRQLTATIKAVYLSDFLINILYSNKPEKYHKQFRKEAPKLLNIKGEGLNRIFDNLHTEVAEASTYFNLKMEKAKSVQDILQEANIKLSLINLDYDQMNKQLVQAKVHLEQLTQELEEKNKILDNLANIDGLTGIFNHRYFQNALDQEISRSSRNNSHLSLILIDIDHFKKFNDTFGHQAGDFILTEFSQTIQNNIRKYDILARYGGEEFVIILPETTGEEALLVGEKIREIVEKTEFNDGLEKYQVTASFGVSTSLPGTEDDFSKNGFISCADQALYSAKNQGRNKVAAYIPKKKWFSF